MTIPRVKATYVLDAETVRQLEAMSRRWGVSKSEALRRAIRSSAASASGNKAPDHRLAALDRLQRAADISGTLAAAWARRAKAERRARSS